MSAAEQQETTQESNVYRPLQWIRDRAPSVKIETSEKSDSADNGSGQRIQIPSPLASLMKVCNLIASGIGNFIWLSARTVTLYVLRHPLHAIFNCCVLGILWVMVLTGSDIHEQMILSEISGKTVDKIVEASRFTREFRSPEVSSSGVREYLKVGGPEWVQSEGVRAILFHARKAGLSVEHQAVLLATAEVESGFNPMAKASTTTACGLFQFVRRTGTSYDLAQKDCMNPWLNADAGIRHYIDNYEKRVASKVENLTGAERVFEMYEGTYYMHHDGPNYSNPSNDVKATVLSGTQFLLKMYELLKQESSTRAKAPTFGERFAENLWDTLHSVRAFFSGIPGGNLAHAQSDLNLKEAEAVAASPAR